MKILNILLNKQLFMYNYEVIFLAVKFTIARIVYFDRNFAILLLYLNKPIITHGVIIWTTFVNVSRDKQRKQNHHVLCYCYVKPHSGLFNLIVSLQNIQNALYTTIVIVITFPTAITFQDY